MIGNHINKNTRNIIEPKTFFSVSLRENIFTLRTSIPIILKLYPQSTYYLICKAKDNTFFSNNLKHIKRLVILDEEQLITFNDFLAIYEEIITSRNLINNKDRLGWYYQQALKIIFTLESNQKITRRFPLVMFDADSILLSKLKFFNDSKHSLPYGSLSECHIEYFKSLEPLFGDFKIPKTGFTTQFFSCTTSEAVHLRNLIKKKYSNNNKLNTKISISRMILDATLTEHKTILGSKFSEQELFGISNNLYSKICNQKPIFSFRSWSLQGILSPAQIKLLKIFGVRLVTYENRVTTRSKVLSWRPFMICFASDMKPQIFNFFIFIFNQYLVKLLTLSKNFFS